MKAIPSQARAKQKRVALIAAASECFVSYGYHNTTAKTVASKAGVATGTFYQYFENKEDMLRVIAKQRMEELYQQVPSATEFLELSSNVEKATVKPGATERIFHQVLELIYAFHEQAPELHQILEQRKELDPELAEILGQGEKMLFHEQAPELHQILEQRKELDPELAEILGQGEKMLYDRVLMFVNRFNIENADAVAFNLFAMAEGLVHRQVFSRSMQSKALTLQLGAAMLASYFDNL